jgi:DNA-directed RNA polymerase specialized sigma subunit
MVGFLKACRAFDPNKGTFSTIFATFAEGEIKHFVRDYNWQVKAPGKVRERGQRAQRLLAEGHTLAEIAEALECSDVELHDALTATSPTDHEVNDFELHVCQRPTPWDYVMAEEADAAV